MNYNTLNSDEKALLVSIILDSTEEPMEFDDFQDTIDLLCEDIPGLECLSEKSFAALVMDCSEIFQQTALPLSGNR